MSVEVHILAHDEEEILPYALRHYLSFAGRLVVHDALSTDRTAFIAQDMGAEVADLFSDGMDDRVHVQIKENCWLGTSADWVIVADADELVYFPNGWRETLDAYEKAGIAVALPTGYEMWSDAMPTGEGQIYHEITQGAVDNKWYGKPVLFSPRRASAIRFTAGCHSCRLGGVAYDHTSARTDPPCWLLHYHQIGGVERIARRYDEKRARLSEYNVKNRLGNFKPGMEHAMEKRAFILANLTQVLEPQTVA